MNSNHNDVDDDDNHPNKKLKIEDNDTINNNNDGNIANSLYVNSNSNNTNSNLKLNFETMEMTEVIITPKEKYVEDNNNDINNLKSNDISVIISSLQNLMKTTYSDHPHAFLIENYPDIVINLGILLDSVNIIASVLFPLNSNINRYEYFQQLYKQENMWPIKHPLLHHQENITFKLLAKGIEENDLLNLILQVIRNLTYELLNEAFISSSTVIMRHIVSILHITLLEGGHVQENFSSSTTSIVIDIMRNISSRIDLNGKKRNPPTNMLEDMSLQDPRTKSLAMLKVSNHYSHNTLLEYRTITYSILSFVTTSLQQSKDRMILVRGLDILLKLATVQENSAVFNNCPQSLLDLLVELLCISYSTVDPLQQYDNDVIMKSMQTVKPLTRMPACVISFFTEINDADVREDILEVMYYLCFNSKKLQARFASTPKCIPMLYRILETKVNRTSNQSIHRATLILQFFAQYATNIPQFQTFRNDFTLGSFQDTTFSELRCQNYYDIFNKNLNSKVESENKV